MENKITRTARGWKNIIILWGVSACITVIPAMIINYRSHFTYALDEAKNDKVLKGVTANAQVLQAIHRHIKASSTVLITYSFTTPDRRIFHSSIEYPGFSEHRVGEFIPILYQSEDPNASMPQFMGEEIREYRARAYRFEMWSALISILLFMALVYFLNRFEKRTVNILKRGIVTDATIIKLHPYEGRSGGFVPEIRFETSGGKIVLQKMSPDNVAKYQINQKIRIIYLQESPDKLLILPHPDFDLVSIEF